MTDIAVSDTGPLISLEKMKDGYGFIRRLYRKIIVPPAVIHEVSRGKYPAFQDYLSFYGAEDLIESVQPFPTVQIPEIKRLQIGEAEAIYLALQFQCPLLIEETLGRKIALLAGLKVSGIAGQVIKAFKRGILDKTEANRKLEELHAGGRINRKIFDALLVR